jgi:uroporphyrinogen III methyltransferase/synthase
LLTLRGAQLLHEADLVLYDYLVNPGVLDHGRHDAEWICLGRHGRASLWEPSRIHAAMIAGARAGKCVVRLKGGDPLVFGRAAGELEALQQAGIPFEIVPGITAGLAAAAYAGLPLTNREMASAVALVTGQEGEGKGGAELDYEALARFPGTIVMYMGVTTAGVWSHQLIHAGMAPETPVLFVRRCSWPNQETLSCRLDEVAAKVLPYSKFPPPAVAIIGEVAIQHKRWGWWEQRPLGGQSVLVTRPRHQAAKLCESLAALGADVVCQPAIEILPPESWDAVDRELDRIHEFDFVVFSSSNGVSAICDRWLTRGRDFRGWGIYAPIWSQNEAFMPNEWWTFCAIRFRGDIAC